MVSIGEFHLPLHDFPLGEAIASESDVRVDFERVVPTDDGVIPLFWAWDGGDFDEFATLVRRSPEIQSLTEIARIESGRLYRAAWVPDASGIVHALSEVDATLLSASGTADGWQFVLRFPDRSRVRELIEFCTDRGLALELKCVYTPRDRLEGTRYGLTDRERETLRSAYEQGYYDEPRGVTQTELARQFDVSQRAISRRLRRGIGRLLGSTVVATDEAETPLAASTERD
ncbi:bacterio-opsin activator domain-containing protein [Halomarina halobia]|uniref:Bacterio-opsin activator domain-containing protein n=1 Tax=Halomarina halobia TaxID=3033386 RepID=A0ABD6A4W5_9EURY|nr:bacterio-opsin activator domain-containing protein [Halomarina sp. PSR21]